MTAAAAASAGEPVAVEDIGRAGRGDLDALRRLRDYLLSLVVERDGSSPLPNETLFARVELLAEMAAAASLQVADRVMLIIVYHLQAGRLQRDRIASEELGQEAAAANNASDADRWARSAAECIERQQVYGTSVSTLLAGILSDPDATGAAMLVSALSDQADAGDDEALPILQFVMDSVTAEQAQSIKALLRQAERD